MAEKKEISITGRIDIAMSHLGATQVAQPNTTNMILDTMGETLIEVTTRLAGGAQVAKTLHTTTVARLKLGEVMITITGTGAINIEFVDIMGTDRKGCHAASIASLLLECLYRL